MVQESAGDGWSVEIFQDCGRGRVTMASVENLYGETKSSHTTLRTRKSFLIFHFYCNLRKESGKDERIRGLFGCAVSEGTIMSLAFVFFFSIK